MKIKIIDLNVQAISSQTYLKSIVTFFAASISIVVAEELLKAIVEKFLLSTALVINEKNAILFKRWYLNEQKNQQIYKRVWFYICASACIRKKSALS